MPDRLKPDVRPRAYAGVELMLDIVHAARTIADVDIESVLIYFCVCEATMRPLVLSASISAEVRAARHPPDHCRGSISMLMAADKLALPRETVRRKIKAMVKKGILLEDSEGRIRVPSLLHKVESQTAARATHTAVLKYIARLRQFDIDPRLPEKQKRSKT